MKRAILPTMMAAIAFSDILYQTEKENDCDDEWIKREYELIQQKKSKLSCAQRKWVVSQYEKIHNKPKEN